MRRIRALALLGIAVAFLVAANPAPAQRRNRGGFGFPGFGVLTRTGQPYRHSGPFTFCRAAFRNNPYGDGGNWQVDYPRADTNFPFRLSQLTRIWIRFDEGGEPEHVVVRLTDPELFQCPFVMMTEVGALYLDQAEATRLREYLLKGGFLWADDFWGEYAWQVWAGEIAKALPPGEFPTIDIPLDHPIFHMLYNVQKFPQIPSIGMYFNLGGGTSERDDSGTPHARAILDKKGRIMVLVSHNTDFGDAFEREGDNVEYFNRFAVEGYAFGINALIYAMTH
jgi:hypothetical protein